MTKEYINKQCKLYKMLKCPKKIHIPVNDMQAWANNPKYRNIYNRLFLTEWQKIYHGIMPIGPTKFPVVLKPIVNLYGMSHDCYLLKNIEEFHNHWYHTGFWSEIAEGHQYSYDIILINGSPIWHTSFRTYADKFRGIGYFDYWKSTHNRKLPDIAQKLIDSELQQYTGAFNIELIGDRIIECHLRFGNIDRYPNSDALLLGIINLYQNKNWSPELIKYIPEKIYYFPIWGYRGIQNKEARVHITEICQKYKLLEYEINSNHIANPTGEWRLLMSITCQNKKTGIKARNEIKKYLESLGYR